MTTTAAPSERAHAVGSVALPTRRDEAWRYAPHAALGRLEFVAGDDADVEVPADLDSRIPDVDGPLVVMVNGRVDPGRSRLGGTSGCAVTRFADATGAAAEELARHREAVVDGYAVINAALGVDGVIVEVADGVECAEPVHVVDVVAPTSEHRATSFGVVVLVGADASTTLVETKIGGNESSGGSNSSTSIVLSERAECDHLVLQDLAAEQIALHRTTVRQAADSRYDAQTFNLGGEYGRLAFDVELAGEGSAADLSGLYFGFGSQSLDQQITVVHAAKDCSSRQSFRGVLDDESTGIFNGGIDVRPGADGTDAQQSNDNLLLSRRAEVNTQPRLEILADEVKCSHGATVGQLDETALYYLRSRGIPEDQARRLLIAGFARQVVDDVPIEAVRQWVTSRLGHDDE